MIEKKALRRLYGSVFFNNKQSWVISSYLFGQAGLAVMALKSNGVVDIPAVRTMVETAGDIGQAWVETLCAETWWRKPPEEVLKTCAERYCAQVGAEIEWHCKSLMISPDGD